ncbi:MAG: XTP/dITP diphosphatase [Clostridia bacterium]|nr:XTP/dITP diphosphatase [Clostridia bacterium]
MRVVAATNNKGKIREISEILTPLGIEVVSLADLGIDIEIMETGVTFEENARIKAQSVALLTNEAVLADDSGLSVDSLNGAPGVYSARYAGENATNEERINKLLSEMKDKENRDAHFETAIVFICPDGREIVTHGEAHGRISLEPFGEGGFGYDPVFFSKDLLKTFAEATEEEKNKVSHRARALMALVEILEREDTEDK